MDPQASNLDFVIVGGGILGTAVAALASAAGHGVLVLRLKDNGVPRADTLRNQGWLQSGIMYRIEDFRSSEDYREFATNTYFAGRDMLRECQLPLPTPAGVICVKRNDRISDLERKGALLRFRKDEFRRLETDEIEALLHDHAESGSTYFAIPDAPFDEAGVLRFLRQTALDHGANFIEVTAPVTLEPLNGAIRIHFNGMALEAPLTLIAAGAGSFELISQLRANLEGRLRRTPLLVGDGPYAMPSRIWIDLDRGFSAVHHDCDGLQNGATVIGTKAKLEPAPFFVPDMRKIPPEEIAKLKECLPPKLAESLLPGRFTAGYEVIPDPSKQLTQFEPWIEDLGLGLFASPGRATMAVFAARKTLSALLGKMHELKGRKVSFSCSGHPLWQEQIHMHYTPHYAFTDEEVT